jgi:vacuolar-type H+-ATPase subunit I/STV1
MFDPDFDPLRELHLAQSNIQQLAAAYNNQQQQIEELTRAARNYAQVLDEILKQNKLLHDMIKQNKTQP